MNRINQLRKEINITQEELAKKLNLSKGIISLYENGTRKPSLDVAISMANIFDCSIDYLLGLTSHKYPKEDLENELYQFNLTEEEYYDAINCFMNDSQQIQSLALILVFSPNSNNEDLTRERKILATIMSYVFDFLPNDLKMPNDKETLTNKDKREEAEKEFYKKFNQALIPAKKLLLSLNKSKIIHNYKDKDEQEFRFAYHKEMEGLTDEEIADALRFYKEMKKKVNKNNN